MAIERLVLVREGRKATDQGRKGVLSGEPPALQH